MPLKGLSEKKALELKEKFGENLTPPKKKTARFEPNFGNPASQIKPLAFSFERCLDYYLLGRVGQNYI
jgi:hypothetical protein